MTPSWMVSKMNRDLGDRCEIVPAGCAGGSNVSDLVWGVFICPGLIVLGTLLIAFRERIADWSNAHSAQTWSWMSPSRVVVGGAFAIFAGVSLLVDVLAFP